MTCVRSEVQNFRSDMFGVLVQAAFAASILHLINVAISFEPEAMQHGETSTKY